MASKGISLLAIDATVEPLAAIRACETLDHVLALAPAPRLVAQLFGGSASKVLISPLSDAILRGLTNFEERQRSGTGVRKTSKPRLRASYSSIALASAANHLLDPQRLATVLSWDDGGFELVPANAPENFTADLTTVFGHYPDPKRRLTLLKSLWSDVCARNNDRAKELALLSETQQRASHDIATVETFVMQTFRSASKTMPTPDAAAMCFEYHVQTFIQSEANLARWASHGRSVKIDVAPWMSVGTNSKSSAQIATAATRLLIDGERLICAVEHLGPLLPKSKKRWGEATRQTPAVFDPCSPNDCGDDCHS